MKEFLKKQSAGIYFSILTIALAVAAMFIYIANGNTNYYNDFNLQIVILTVIAIVLEVIFLIVVRVIGEKQWMDIFYLAVPILLGVTAMVFASLRVESAGIILGSDLEAGNVEAVSALTQSFVGIGIYLAAMVVGAAGSFLKQIKE